MKLLFTVCGRAGSQGIKNKNIRKFLGFPLVCYTISTIDLFLKKHPEIIGDIAINTDSEELRRIAQSIQKIIYVKRKEDLKGGSVPKIDVISDTLKQAVALRNKTYDMVVDLDITSPLRTVKDLENLIKKKASAHTDVVFSVVPARRNPYFNMVEKKSDGSVGLVIKSKYTCRQQAPAIYDMNASLYAYEPSFLNKGKMIFEGIVDIIEMYDTAVLDLDHENDFIMMEIIAKSLFDTRQDFKEIRENIKSMYFEEGTLK